MAVAPQPRAEQAPAFRRILLKLSGEALMGKADFGLDAMTIDELAQELVEVHSSGVELALVIGGVGTVAGALFAGIFGLGLIILQETWHLTLFRAIEFLAPGLAALGIIQNPSGAVVPIGEGFAPLLP